MERKRSYPAASKRSMDLAVSVDTVHKQFRRIKVQKITPFLWFDNKAEEAVNFYISVFKNSKVNTTKRYGDAGPGPKGSVMIVSFQLEGQDFIALNGGPSFKFTPALSLYVDCVT